MKKNRKIMLMISTIIIGILIAILLAMIFTREKGYIFIGISVMWLSIMIYIETFTKGKIFTYKNLVNIFGVLYINYFFLECIQKSIEPTFNHYKIFFIANISIIVFNIVYSFSENKIKISKLPLRNKQYNEKILKIIILFIFLFAIFLEFYVINLKIGIKNYIFVTRAERSLLMKPYGALTIYKDLFILCMTISYYKKNTIKSKVYSLIFYISLFSSLFNAVISISRADMIMIVIPIICLSVYLKKITNKQVIVIGIVGFILFGAWKGVLSGIIFKSEVKNINIDVSSEFSTWYDISENVLSDLDNGNNEFLLGKSYMDTIKNLIIPITDSEPLSVWYVKKYEYLTYLKGGGRGFSSILEAYMNFGIVGNIIYFSILGIIFSQFNKISEKDVKYLIIYAISSGCIYKIFRSESYSFFKNWFWFYIIPILIIFKLSEIRRRK